jgi:hypothetical protein
MNEMEQVEFSKAMMILAEVYNRKLSQLLLQTYWDCLKDYPLSVFQNVLCQFLKNPDHAKKGFPSPAEWIKVIEGDSESRGLAAWTQVLKAIRQVGQYESVRFDDSLVHTVIADMGGWIFLCKQPERELIFLQKEFERRYREVASSQKKRPLSTHLIGHIEQQNRINGYEQYIPKVLEVSHFAREGGNYREGTLRKKYLEAALEEF